MITMSTGCRSETQSKAGAKTIKTLDYHLWPASFKLRADIGGVIKLAKVSLSIMLSK